MSSVLPINVKIHWKMLQVVSFVRLREKGCCIQEITIIKKDKF